jgi:hypothetical protein
MILEQDFIKSSGVDAGEGTRAQGSSGRPVNAAHLVARPTDITPPHLTQIDCSDTIAAP